MLKIKNRGKTHKNPGFCAQNRLKNFFKKGEISLDKQK